ncbi:MAG: hypothetical protein OEW21_11275 [Betaproteobacteria bacterium]|nr:hypothetical protein [Betaproteobacteria bacterium]
MTPAAPDARRRIAAPWWPRLVQLLPLELVLVMAIAGLTIALCVASVPAAQFKARFTEILGASIPQRLTLAEHIAITGTWEGLQAQSAAPGAAQRAAPMTYGEISGGIVTIHGRAPGNGAQPPSAAFRPALALNDLPWTMLWLCGSAVPPEGWTAPALAAPHNLSQDFLLSNCREDKYR